MDEDQPTKPKSGRNYVSIRQHGVSRGYRHRPILSDNNRPQDCMCDNFVSVLLLFTRVGAGVYLKEVHERATHNGLIKTVLVEVLSNLTPSLHFFCVDALAQRKLICFVPKKKEEKFDVSLHSFFELILFEFFFSLLLVFDFKIIWRLVVGFLCDRTSKRIDNDFVLLVLFFFVLPYSLVSWNIRHCDLVGP